MGLEQAEAVAEARLRENSHFFDSLSETGDRLHQSQAAGTGGVKRPRKMPKAKAGGKKPKKDDEEGDDDEASEVVTGGGSNEAWEFSENID